MTYLVLPSHIVENGRFVGTEMSFWILTIISSLAALEFVLLTINVQRNNAVIDISSKWWYFRFRVLPGGFSGTSSISNHHIIWIDIRQLPLISVWHAQPCFPPSWVSWSRITPYTPSPPGPGVSTCLSSCSQLFPGAEVETCPIALAGWQAYNA